MVFSSSLIPSLLLFLLPFSVTPSAAQGPATPSLATAPFSSSDVSAAQSTSNAPAASASFANVTTTNAQGSAVVTSIPITISPTTTPATTASLPYPSLSGYTACVTGCLTDAVAQVNCTSITAVSCYCVNKSFPNALYSCVVANCSASVPSAESLAQQFCALDNTTLTFSSTAGPSTSLPSGTAPTSSTSRSTSTSTQPFNAALAASWMSDVRGWTGMALAACGAVFGAAFL